MESAKRSMRTEALQRVEDWSVDDLFARLEQAGSPRGIIVSYAHCETMYLILSQQRSRSTLQRVGHIYIDGVGAQLAMLMLDGRWRRRFTAEDFVEPLCERWARRGRRVAFVGGEPGRSKNAPLGFSKEARSAIAMCLDGYGDVADIENICTQLDRTQTDLVILGLGQPLQESLALEISARRPHVSILCVGALFAQILENPPIARALRGFGLEWTVRLCRSPRRLAARYLLHPWKTVAWIVACRLRLGDFAA